MRVGMDACSKVVRGYKRGLGCPEGSDWIFKPSHHPHTTPFPFVTYTTPFLTLLPLPLSQPSLFCPIVVSLVDVAEKMKQTIAFVYRPIHRFFFL